MKEIYKLILLSIFFIVTSLIGTFILLYHEPIILSLRGTIDDAQVKPIMICGKLFEPVFYDKLWVIEYTLGYANSTNKFYIKYGFVYEEIMPHKRQYTKWQDAPITLIAFQWDNIESFAGSWLPPEAYPFDSEIITYGGSS